MTYQPLIPTVLTPVGVSVLSDPAAAILAVAEALQLDLAHGFQIDALRLRLEMERAFGGSDATGAWEWKLAYEAGEVALILFLRKFGRALLARAGSPAALLPILPKVAGLLPTHTRRSEEMQRFQQFSTPLPMGLAALAAAQITPRDLVLEPSAGTGLLTILAEIAGGSLALNELADTRADLLRLLFPGCPVTRFDAAQIDDHLDAGMRPSVILMNPPFSAMANVDGRTTEATARHLRSALARLAPGGRLVAITGASFAPDAPAWAETFDRLTESAHLVFTGAVSGAAFAKHGTSFETRISVFDKCRGGEVGGVTADLRQPMSPDAAHLLARITAEVPPRFESDQTATASQGRSFPFPGNSAPSTRKAIGIPRATSSAQPAQAIAKIEAEDLAYTLREGRDNDDTTRLSDAIYETFRLVYVSATGATSVHNLAYAQRLGLWGGEDFPFATRAEFVEAIEAGGVAAMEVLARDLRSLGLYTARSLSYDGVEYEMLEHALTPEQRGIYDAYAGAFAIIHNNLAAAMEAANITGPASSTGSNGTLNRQAKSAALSAFESAKQRFFGHLLTSMKTPTLIASIEADLAAGHTAVIQIVSTGQALMERRLSEIPTDEWNDIRVDITPREYVLDYLAHSFPVQLYEPFTDSEGHLSSRPVVRDGQPVECREAARRRDALIEKLAGLPPVPGALDQIVQRFGTDVVAEVTGRSRRIVRKGDGHAARLVVESRAGSANLAETAAFMDDQKRILIFSDAGGTGRSYHADLGAKNQRLRVHYLLEPGWKADAAIQGLGRTNRTNQARPPLFRPIATDVKAEKRFLSTIARRLDTLGAITRGQRQTGGQGLFRPEDNLESPYARDALRQLARSCGSG